MSWPDEVHDQMNAKARAERLEELRATYEEARLNLLHGAIVPDPEFLCLVALAYADARRAYEAAGGKVEE